MPEKPIGCFLFSGPTGVGKTEAREAARDTLGISFLRFDMSEYMERHTVSRLIGAPRAMSASTRVASSPMPSTRSRTAVLLLDEIEKAHPDLFNILLQIMDHGRLTDNNGKSSTSATSS